jgi:hypothetical protein
MTENSVVNAFVRAVAAEEEELVVAETPRLHAAAARITAHITDRYEMDAA